LTHTEHDVPRAVLEAVTYICIVIRVDAGELAGMYAHECQTMLISVAMDCYTFTEYQSSYRYICDKAGEGLDKFAFKVVGEIKEALVSERG